MHWHRSHRADTRALPLADRHYSRQKVGSPQFVPPGSCYVLLTERADALWTTSFPIADYVRHAWAGAWINTFFRNESEYLSSELIREAIAATRDFYGEPPPLGIITFIDPTKVKKKRDFGRCYRRAGFRQAICPNHMIKMDSCATCNGRTKGGLIALQMLPASMPRAMPAMKVQGSLFNEEAA